MIDIHININVKYIQMFLFEISPNLIQFNNYLQVLAARMHLLSRTVQPFKRKTKHRAYNVVLLLLFTCGLASLDLDLGRWSPWRRLNVPFCHPDCCESWWILLQQHLQDTSSSIRSVCMKHEIYMGVFGAHLITGVVTLVSPKMYLWSLWGAEGPTSCRCKHQEGFRHPQSLRNQDSPSEYPDLHHEQR